MIENPIQERLTIHRQVRPEPGSSIWHNWSVRSKALQKMACLGTMSCMAGHEFNNVLMLIVNYAELALNNPEDTKLAHKALQNAVKQGNRASTMIQGMLKVARENSQEPQHVAVDHIVQDCFTCLIRDLSKDNIKVTVDIPEALHVHVVPGQLQQVILNMIINARQAMLIRGGHLTVAARRNNGQVTIEIADSGEGIPRSISSEFSSRSSRPKPMPKRPNPAAPALV